MKTGDEGGAPVLRLWWAVPLGLVILTAVVFVAVVLPALATRPGVPSELVVHRSPAPANATPTVSVTPHPNRTSATPEPTRSTTVVRPEQPVVRESDDRHEDKRERGTGESDDR